MSFASRLLPADCSVSLLVLFISGIYPLQLEAAEQDPSAVEIMTVDRAVAQALEGNPSLAEIGARAAAMAAIPAQEGALPDPMLSFNALNLPSDSFDLRQDEMTMLEVGVSQKIPFPGKLALREKAAELDAEAAAHTVEEARLRLARDVKIRWWQLFSLERSLRIIFDTEQLLKQLTEIARTKYEVGEGLQQDVLLAKLELTRLSQQRVAHLTLHHTEIARLNALLNRPAGSLINLPDQVETELPDVRPEADLQQSAERTRPLLAQRRKAIDAAHSRLHLAEKDYYPDFELGAGYAVRQSAPNGLSRSDFASFRLSLNLPLYAGRKQAKALDQRNSELLREKYALDDAVRKIQADINAALAAYLGARERLRLFESDTIPAAEQTVSAMLGAYQVSKVDFLNLIRAQNTLFDYEMQYWQALAEAHQALARLTAAAGREAP